jgi:hypothetical protein
VDIKEGDMLPLLCWGNFTTEAKFKHEAKANNTPEEFPAIPGVFALQKPYEELVCMIADNCPARYVNDSKGVKGATPNIVFVQHSDPRDLFHDPLKGLHLFLQAQATRDIKAGDQLFTPYGGPFWLADGHEAINKPDIDPDTLLDVGDINLDADGDSDNELMLLTPRGQLESKATPKSSEGKKSSDRRKALQHYRKLSSIAPHRRLSHLKS